MILIVYGTRPEYIKIKSLLELMRKGGIAHRTLFTGQHQDLVDSLPDFTAEIKEGGNNRLDSILQDLMNLDPKIFDGVNYVLVQGDTTTALAMSIAAIHRQIKVIHLEAGLRTYDVCNPFPEEYNRQLISRMSFIHLCPTEQNKQNLIRENILDRVYVVGNTGLDGISHYSQKCYYGKKILITLHRRENHSNLKLWFEALEFLAREYEDYDFIMPLHPNPSVQKYRQVLKKVSVIDPLNREDLLDLLVESSLVITDSGGIQEECSFFNKKCLVCRKITERPESLGKTSFLVDCPDNLKTVFESQIKSLKVNEKCPFGNGNSAEKILEILIKI